MIDRLRPEDLSGRKTIDACHVNMGSKGSIWMFGIEGVPRLGISDHYDRSRRTSKRSWSIDGQACRDLDDALAVINGDMTLEQAMERASTQELEKPLKFSLVAQIDEVDREIQQREKVYPRLVAGGSMRESIAAYQMARMKAVRATLIWLQQNEAVIKAKVDAVAPPAPPANVPVS